MKWKLLALAAVVVAVVIFAGGRWFDAPVLLFMRQFDAPVWHILSTIFDDKVWAAFFIAAVGVVYIKNSLGTNNFFAIRTNWFKPVAFIRDFWQKTKNSNAFLILCAIVAAGVVVQVLKVLVGRTRPILYEALEFSGFYPPSLDWAFNSMPSGHTAISFAALVMIGMLWRRVRPVTWSVAVLVGVARVCVGDHWPTDVILGAFIGMVTADVVKWRLRGEK